MGNLADIHSRSVYPASITMENGTIIDISRIEKKLDTFIVPGFIDAHIHIESSLLIPENFGPVALSHGTIATVSDPHEIANVCGLEGINFMIRNGLKSRLKFFWTAPSCVPATSFETSGGVIKASDLNILFENPNVVALGEMMNYPGVIYKDRNVLEKCDVARKNGRVLDGHAPGVTGEELKAYVSAGISTDHECATLAEALEKIENGMKILIREGSSARNFEALHPLLISHPEDVMLCSDDLHADDLIKGHINLLIKRSIQKGVPLFNVLRAVSIIPAMHYDLPVGLLRIGDPADFLIVDNLEDFTIRETWVNGERVCSGNGIKYPATDQALINNFHATPVTIEEFKLNAAGTFARIIEVQEGSIVTKSSVRKVEGDIHSWISDNHLLYLFVKNRYYGKNTGRALVSGFGDMKGAIASTIAHDSHNLIAIGSSEKDISEAMNMLIGCQGGIAFVSEDIREVLPLPVAGLMSDAPADVVSEKYEKVIRSANQHGCILNSPLMTLSFLALLVIPELKLSDRGLFDVKSFNFTELFFD